MILGWLKLTLLLAMSGVLLGMLVSAIVTTIWKAHVEIDDANLPTHPHQGNRQMNGDCRLAGTALFVADDDNPGLALLR